MKKEPKLEPQKWIVVSDTHVGAKAGIHPHHDHNIQKGLLNCWNDAIARAGEFDVLLHLGDVVDGPDKKGYDVLTGDLTDQAELAAELMAMWKPKKEYIFLTGTRYHTDSNGVQIEKVVVSNLKNLLTEQGRDTKVTLERKLNTSINDWFHLEARHKTNRSVVPYGATTPQARNKIWNVLNGALSARRSGDPIDIPNLILYGHVHYWTYHEDDFGAVASVPCWSAIGSRYGDEECDGRITIGAVELLVYPTKEGGFSCRKLADYPVKFQNRKGRR